MIPEEELLSKPINLRNVCLFYLGHIPTFLDIHISRATSGPPTEPSYFRQIFERGIDPDVDDPALCHSHSETPDTWPPKQKILEFQKAVRNRVKETYKSGATRFDGQVARGLWLAFEHEVMHLETLLYMLVQSKKILPPPNTVKPDFPALAKQAASNAVPNKWFTIPEADISLGLDDPDTEPRADRYFGWDNEKPRRSIHVHSFSAQARPVTNGEYFEYLRKTGKTALPASWSVTPYEFYPASLNGVSPPTNGANGHMYGINGHANGANGHTNGFHDTNGNTNVAEGRYVRTVYGAIPLEYALDWPVVASYDELAGCAKWMGGRIPTMEETRSIYAYVERTSANAKEAENSLGKTIPAVNRYAPRLIESDFLTRRSQMVNEGVEESPPSRVLPDGSGCSDAAATRTLTNAKASTTSPDNLFIDLEGKNVGFKHWHPTPVTQNGNTLAGQCDFGGAWEWTSTVLEKHEGFEPMSVYPGYTGKGMILCPLWQWLTRCS
jgi:formylglycine-generating enzyme required for sulfatase activity